MELKIGQINAQRAMAAAANLELLIRELHLDILCIQEPYTYKGIVRGYTSHNFSKIQPGVEKPWVAAIIANNKIEVFHLAHFDTPHIMCFQVMSEIENFYIINVYCQFSLQIELFLNDLENIISKIKPNKIIITMDANAKSDLWFSEELDDRGRAVEDFLITNRLYVINENNELPTYESISGQSNIDLTLVSENMMENCKKWTVSPKCTTSDHNLITFQVIFGGKMNRRFIKSNYYNTKKANWENFKSLLTKSFTDNVLNTLQNDEPEKAVKTYTTILDQVSKKSIPYKKQSNRSVPWWNEKLAEMRKKVNKAKKNFNKIKKFKLQNLDEAKNNYRQIRNKYVIEIRKSKQESWQNFVTIEANKDPWSIPYKIIRDKIKRDEVITSLKLSDGTNTNTWKDTMSSFLAKCVPKDDKQNKSDRHKQILDESKRYINCNMENIITMQEINNAIIKLKNNKAPGVDKFTAEIIKQVWKENPQIIYNLLNNCFREEIFPDLWKVTRLKVILKGHNKDRKLLSSYRPISLIPTMSKVFERIIIERLQTSYRLEELENPNQYGFRPERSTEDAIAHLLRSIKNTDKKYVVTIFIDIQGAFDNLWWPAIIRRLINAKCSSKLINIIKSYFKNRKVNILTKYEKFTAKMERGCPQGSVLGPVAWNWCMDLLLNDLAGRFPDSQVEAVAYADDVAMLIKENSRANLEKTAAQIINIVEEWCNIHKLKIAAEKTIALLVKGKLDKARPPVIKINNSRVSFCNQTKYLGVIIDDKLNFINHAKYIRSKLTNLIMAIRRIAKEEWGIKQCGRKILYNMVAVPIASYASTVWYDKTKNVMVKRHLMAAQRSLLLMITKATRLTSTNAMQIIAGIKPLDLSIVERGLKSKVKKNQAAIWENYTFTEQENIIKLREEYNKIEIEINRIWELRWEMDNSGRQTFQVIPNVEFTSTNKWFRPNRECVYLLTGYGPINSSLYKRGAEDTDRCPFCTDKVETVEHMVKECKEYQDFRYQDIDRIKEVNKELIKTEQDFKNFNKYAKDILTRRKTKTS